MSQQLSSSEVPAETHAADGEILEALKRYFAQHTAPSFHQQLLLKLQDPFSRSANGGFKLNGLWLGLGMLASLTVLVFGYFNFMKH